MYMGCSCMIHIGLFEKERPSVRHEGGNCWCWFDHQTFCQLLGDFLQSDMLENRQNFRIAPRLSRNSALHMRDDERIRLRFLYLRIHAAAARGCIYGNKARDENHTRSCHTGHLSFFSEREGSNIPTTRNQCRVRQGAGSLSGVSVGQQGFVKLLS